MLCHFSFIGLKSKLLYINLALCSDFSYTDSIFKTPSNKTYFTQFCLTASQIKITTTKKLKRKKMVAFRNTGGSQATLNSLLLIELAFKVITLTEN